MNPHLNSAIEKLKEAAEKVKILLSQDYSLQDLRKLPNVLREWWKNSSSSLVKNQDSSSGNGSGERSLKALFSKEGFDLKQILGTLYRFFYRQRHVLLIGVILILLGLAYQMLLIPYSRLLHEQLEMRPAQWSQLQSLIRLNRNASASGASANSGMPSTVSLLDEAETQRILNSLNTRGLKPSVFRLTSDNPPRLEFQMSDVMFSSFLEAVEDLRLTWRLYPSQLSVIANGGAGMVNVSGVLVQYGTQAGVNQ